MITKVCYQECEGHPTNVVVNKLYKYEEFVRTHPKTPLDRLGEWIPFPTEEGHDYFYRVYTE